MRTLVSYLNEKTPQELKAIAEIWEANLTDRLYTGNTFQLAHEMQSEFLQRRLLEKLDASSLQLLAFFASQPANAGLTLEEVATNFEGLEVGPIVARLRQLGLLFDERIRPGSLSESNPGLTGHREGQEGQRGWATLYRRNTDPPAITRIAVMLIPRELARPLHRLVNEKMSAATQETGMRLSHLPLLQLLGRLEPETIESLAEPWGIAALQGSAESGEIAAELARSLSDKALQHRILEELPGDSQELFEQLKRQGGRTTILRLRKEFVSLKRLGRYLRPLTEHLLVWEVFEEGDSVVFIPPEISRPTENEAGRSFLPLQTVTQPANSTIFPPYALAWDCLTLLNYLGQNEVELTNQRYIPKRHLKKLMGMFWVEEDLEEAHRFAFLSRLCEKLDLYTVDSYTRRMLPGLGLHDWLRLDFYDQTRKFFETWINSPYFHYWLNYPYYYNSAGGTSQANKAMVNWLAECQPGSWYSMASLLHKVQREEPFFIRSRRDLLNQFGLQRVEEIARRWPHVEGEIIRNTFGTVLEWLGIVRIGRDEEGRVDSFALTELGAELVGVPGTPRQNLPRVEKPILVQPNFEIMLFAPQVDTIWALLKFATLKKLDQVSLYAVDKTSLLRGMESGMTATVLLEWLAARSPQPLPQNLQVSVQDWSKGFRRVMVERTVLLEVEDPAVLDELLQTKQYAEYFVRRLSPTAAVVKLSDPKSSFMDKDPRNDPIKAFRNKLKSGGFFTT